jgi:hypothetical protein
MFCRYAALCLHPANVARVSAHPLTAAAERPAVSPSARIAVVLVSDAEEWSFVASIPRDKSERTREAGESIHPAQPAEAGTQRSCTPSIRSGFGDRAAEVRRGVLGDFSEARPFQSAGGLAATRFARRSLLIGSAARCQQGTQLAVQRAGGADRWAVLCCVSDCRV